MVSCFARLSWLRQVKAPPARLRCFARFKTFYGVKLYRHDIIIKLFLLLAVLEGEVPLTIAQAILNHAAGILTGTKCPYHSAGILT